jgi:hypothetical protein
VTQSSSRASTGFFADPPPELERTLNERYGESARGLVFNRSMRCSETSLDEGARLLVLGTVAADGAGLRFVKGRAPFIVSAGDEAGLVSHYARRALLYRVAAGLVVLAALVLGGVSW